MRKRYILLKDTPEVKAGAILEEKCDIGNQVYVVIKAEYQKKDGRYDGEEYEVIYWKRFVEEQPDWFEEVDLLWLTKDQIKKVKKILKI